MPTTSATTAGAGTAVARPAGLRTAVILLGAIVIAVAIDTGIAAVAVAAGAPAGYGPLTLPALASMTTVGVLGGWVGWRLVQRRARDPRRVLAVLVPVVVAVSLMPDVLLLATRFVPGTTAIAVIALMVMHPVVALVAVPAYRLAWRRRPAA